MPPNQQKYYDTMRQQAITVLEEGDCTPVNVLSQMVRLHQISCGHVVVDDGTIVRTSNFRLTVLMEIIEDLPDDSKVIIWATYRDDIRVIVEELEDIYGKSVVQYHGIQSEDRAHRIGQTNKVTYIDLICRKTVDEKIVSSLTNKKSIASSVLGDQWKDWI